MRTKLLLLLSIISTTTFAQMVSPTAGKKHGTKLERGIERNEDLPYNESLAPFYHGVASGDPLSDRVIIWTRVTDTEESESIEVEYFVATDKEMTNIISEGTVTTNAEKDYTVKVDVTGLDAATTYYYLFRYNDKNSLTGRTRTTPSTSEADHLRFAVVSCSNYQAGYFNAYARISEREDLDAVIHLGDYIYEYGAGEGTYGYSEDRADRANIPETEILATVDYRTRYSLYRLDPDLRAAHQQHPFIPIWDDHESANDAYKDGAENHQEGEGDWEERKNLSKEVWFEWMPVRETEDRSIYRTISYGDLADLIMVDTRLEGRDEQPTSVLDTVEYKTLLGEDQKNWLVDELTNSEAKWKILGNQVIFAQLNVGFAATDATGAPAPTNYDAIVAVESIFVDIWDGYPKERAELIEEFESNDIDNIVILTGDFHSTFAFDVTQNPVEYPNVLAGNLPTPSNTYDPETGDGSVAVEFATPSISSANFDENVGAELSAQFEFSFNNNLEALGGVNYNPHMKYVDLDQHGYFVLDIKEEATQADWYFVNILEKDNETQTFGQGWKSEDTANHLIAASGESTGKTNAPDLAPSEISDVEFAITNVKTIKALVLNSFPNPIQSGGNIHLNVAFNQDQPVKIDLVDINGAKISNLMDQEVYTGNYAYTFELPEVESGIYFLQIITNSITPITRKIIVE